MALSIPVEDAAQAVHNLLNAKDIDPETVAAIFEFSFGVIGHASYNEHTDEIDVEPAEGFTDEETDLEIYR